MATVVATVLALTGACRTPRQQGSAVLADELVTVNQDGDRVLEIGGIWTAGNSAPNRGGAALSWGIDCDQIMVKMRSAITKNRIVELESNQWPTATTTS